MAQSIIFLPTIMSSAVMGLVFYLLFNAYNGEVNKILMSAHIINRPINWLGKDHAMQTLIITAIWGGVGNYMVYFIAGIQQVSQDAIESARIDGAGRLKNNMVYYNSYARTDFKNYSNAGNHISFS